MLGTPKSICYRPLSVNACIHLPDDRQTDFTYLKVIGWDWFYLSTILDDLSHYVVAWKLCTTMKIHDVTDTLNLTLEASGYSSVKVEHKPRLLSNNDPRYIAENLGNEITAFIDHYNHCLYYEKLGNLTATDTFPGKGKAIFWNNRKGSSRKQSNYVACNINRRPLKSKTLMS